MKIYMKGPDGIRVRQEGWNWWGTFMPGLWLTVKGMLDWAFLVAASYVVIPFLYVYVLGVTNTVSIILMGIVLNVVTGLLIGKYGWARYFSHLQRKGYQKTEWEEGRKGKYVYDIYPVRIVIRAVILALVIGFSVLYFASWMNFNNTPVSSHSTRTLYSESPYYRLDLAKHPYTFTERIGYVFYVAKTAVPLTVKIVKNHLHEKRYQWLLYACLSLFPLSLFFSALAEHYGSWKVVKWSAASVTGIFLIMLLLGFLGAAQCKRDYEA